MIDYESGKLGYINENKYFAVDECNIVTIGNKKIQVLQIIIPKILLIREIEFKIKTKNLNMEDKIFNFIECYNTTKNVSDNDYKNNDNLFMDNLGLNNKDNDSDND